MAPSRRWSRCDSQRGTCRDFALLMMEAVARSASPPASSPATSTSPSRDGKTNLGGGSTHAWCQVYLPGAGWVEFDPTNGIVGNRDLIRVAVARDPRQAVPLSGSYYGNASDDLGMTVQVNVTTEDRSMRRRRKSGSMQPDDMLGVDRPAIEGTS